MKFNVFGRQVIVVKGDAGWTAFYSGSDGKRRPAPDLVVPADISESNVEQYLGDLCHEWATEQHPTVERLD